MKLLPGKLDPPTCLPNQSLSDARAIVDRVKKLLALEEEHDKGFGPFDSATGDWEEGERTQLTVRSSLHRSRMSGYRQAQSRRTSFLMAEYGKKKARMTEDDLLTSLLGTNNESDESEQTRFYQQGCFRPLTLQDSCIIQAFESC
eukprot:CAMPEP_0184750034 /NCGR_PEP_ID=MMETSP0315-20130426/32842_1 /TAXON_ID=101924 /ORGANISM="Rhodosorus marinus, Strain UTEX LB 2760" /LENGTH=144 /DNA_ID=CAMNT_0027227719 /DNA_START=174 /DNA_END=605 /DNA_ORIENTATION=-